MAINPYTLYGLYEKGILDYVPTDLISPAPMAMMSPMANSYMNMAKQGSLYQQYGNGDSFSFSGNNNYSYMNNSQIGSHSSVAQNAYGLQGIGYASNAGANAYGLQGIGEQSNAGGVNAWGGISDFRENVSNNFNKVSSVVSATPTLIKGLVSALIIGATGYMIFKKGKKPVTEKKSFLSKLNPFKRGKAKKTAEEAAKKTEKAGLFTRIKNKFSTKKTK